VTASDLCFTPAVELAMLIRRHELSPVEITRAVVDRIERLNGRLGAYVLVHAERALKQARDAEQAVMAGEPLGPLHGVPLSDVRAGALLPGSGRSRAGRPRVSARTDRARRGADDERDRALRPA